MDDNFVMDIDSDKPKFKFDSTNNVIKQVAQIYPNSGNPQAGRIYNADGISPSMDTCQGGNRMPKVMDNKSLSIQDLKIRKLTPKECFRLMGFSDDDFERAAFVKEAIKLEGGNSICNAKLKVVTDEHEQNDMETYVLNIINNTQDMEILSIKTKKLAEMLENEKIQNVNIVIEKLEGLERLECATNTIKCGDYMGMHYILTTEKDPHRMAIIVQVKKGLGNTEKYMKITTEPNLLQNKLYTILTLFAQIIGLKIFTSTTVSLNIQGFMQSIEDYEKNILMKLSNLKMERITSRNSNSALYKQAGNSIVVNVLVEIYKCLQQAYPNDFKAGMNVISLFSGIGAFEKALDRMEDANGQNK